jgi:hypothetical protein
MPVDHRFITEYLALSFNFLQWPVGEIGDGALADFAILTPSFAKQEGGSGVAIWDFVDTIMIIYMATLFRKKSP